MRLLLCVATLGDRPPRDGLSRWKGSPASLRCLFLLNRGRGFSDHIEHEVRLGQHRYMAAIGLEGCCSHALRDETLQLGLDSAVLRSYDVPTRLGFPRSAFRFLFEQICYRCGMSGPDQLLLFLWEITCKGWDTVTFQPNASVCNLDMGENIGCRKL